MCEYSGSLAPAMATSLADMAMEADDDAMIADSSSLFGALVRRLEVASAKALDFPGKWIILNFQRPVRCFRRKRRGSVTALRGLKPRRVACANISKLIPRPGHGDMLRAWVYYEAKRSLNQKKCLSLVLFSLKTAF